MVRGGVWLSRGSDALKKAEWCGAKARPSNGPDALKSGGPRAEGALVASAKQAYGTAKANSMQAAVSRFAVLPMRPPAAGRQGRREMGPEFCQTEKEAFD